MERFGRVKKYLALVSLSEHPTEIRQTLDKLLPDQRRINSKSSMDTLRSLHLGRRHCNFISKLIERYFEILDNSRYERVDLPAQNCYFLVVC